MPLGRSPLSEAIPKPQPDPPLGRFLSVSLALTVPLAAFLRVVLPTSTGGGDSEFYRQLAEHPLRPIEGAPNAFFQFRPLVPTIVWALPLPTDLGFHVATMISLVAGALLIASLTRAVGVGWLALAAGPVYVLSFVGFYGLLQFRMIDTATVAIWTATLLAAYAGRPVAVAVLSVFGVAAKEICLLLPIAYGLVRSTSRPFRRAAAATVAVAVPAVVVFILIRLLMPYTAPYGTDVNQGVWSGGLKLQGQWGYGRVLPQVLMQNLGLLWLLWPLGLVVAPPRWRRLSLFVLVVAPFLAGGAWARTAIYLWPFVLPSALLVLRRGTPVAAVLALAGSAWVAVLLSLRNIAVDAPGPLATNAALVPGMLLFAVAAAPAVLEVLGRARTALLTDRARKSPRAA
jgi:hypothetical protein